MYSSEASAGAFGLATCATALVFPPAAAALLPEGEIEYRIKSLWGAHANKCVS